MRELNEIKPTFHLKWGLIFIFYIIMVSADAWALDVNQGHVKGLSSYAMGIIYDLEGKTDLAIESFERSREFDDTAAVHLRLGADYARIGKLPEAIEELHIVTTKQPDNAQARYLLALIYSTQREYDKAAQEYESILTSLSLADPKNIEIYGYLGQLYYSQRQYDKAIKQFETILEITPDNTDVMFLLGSLYLENDDQDKALSIFSRAIKYEPDNDICLNSLAYIYAEKGIELDTALSMAKRALEIDPDNGAYLDSLGWVYYKKGEYEDALKYLKKADYYLKDPAIYEHIGDVYYKLKSNDEAKKYWVLSLEMFPNQKQVQDKLKLIEE